MRYTPFMSEELPIYNPEEGPTTEEEAYEILHSDQELSPTEQERLVQVISDPDLSMYVLGDDPYGKKFTEKQEAKLFAQVLTNRETVEIFYTNLTESGVELSETEKSWYKRLEEIRSQD